MNQLQHLSAKEFVSLATAKGLGNTIPVEMATSAATFLEAFYARCEALTNGTYTPLRSEAATMV